MQDNDRLEESAMDSNRFRMAKINRLFSITFYVCAVIPVLQLIVGILNVAVALITLGLAAANPFTLFKSILLYAVMIAAFIWSYLKDIRGTIAAILSVIVWCLIGWTSWSGDLFLSVMTIAWLALQIACLTKYKDLKFLRDQPGYPYFNGVSLHENTDKRSIREQQLREQTAEFSGKPSVMDELYANGHALEEKKQKTDSGDQYMEDIFTDDLHKDI